MLETAQLDNPNLRRGALQRLRARAINATLSRHLVALDRAVAENSELIPDIQREQEAAGHLRALRDTAATAKREMDAATEDRPAAQSSRPGP
jgi:hypothetical protein